MNLQQLRILRETARRGFNLTEAAEALATSQSGLSRHIKDLEHELGIQLFVRHGKRFLGLTDAGREILPIVERMLIDAASLKRAADEIKEADQGALVIAATHTQARYALPKAVVAFRKAFPRVRLSLHETGPDEIAAMLLDGRACVGISTERLANHPELEAFPWYAWRHAAIVPKGHPLEDVRPLALSDLARWPIITYQTGFTGRALIDRAFERAGERPEIVMDALDADVIKDYVALGLGVGIVAHMAMDPARDHGLALLPTDHLFEETTTRLAVRRGRYLRGFVWRFLDMCCPGLWTGSQKT